MVQDTVANSTDTYHERTSIRYAEWVPQDGLPCHGRARRDVCNLGLADLPRVRVRAHGYLFVNKFDLREDEGAAAECWKEMMVQGARKFRHRPYSGRQRQ